MKINVAKHIFDNLVHNRKVTIPALGTFSLQHIPASFGEGRKSLLPPAIEITHQHQEESDFEIYKYLAKKEGISESKAKQFLLLFAEKVKQTIEAKGKAELGYLGTFDKSESGIDWIQNQKTVNTFYKGLPEISLPEISANKEKKPEALVPAVEDKPTTIHEKLKADSLAKAEEKVAPITPKPKESSNGCIKWLVPFITLLFILGALSTFYWKSLKTDSTIFRSKDAKKKTTEKVLPAIDSTDAFKADSLKIEDGTCVIILNVFADTTNISALSDKIEKSGYKLHESQYGPASGEADTFYRIGIEFECDRQDTTNLQVFIKKLRKEFQNGGAWYLVPKLFVN